MLEILYESDTKVVRAWNADMDVTGNLKPNDGQEVVILPIGIPRVNSDWYKVDIENQIIVGNPDYIAPIARDLIAEVDSLKAIIERLGI